MELSWLMKLRLAASAVVGIVLIGILAWPLSGASEPLSRVSIPSVGQAIALVALAVLVGLLAFFLSWPYGREIGILAVPAGLAIWAFRSTSIASQLQKHPTLAQRQELFSALKWEPVFWLAIVAVGFGAVVLGEKILKKNSPEPQKKRKPRSKSNTYLNIAIAVVASAVIAQICLTIFAQDIRLVDNRLGSILAQPSASQIAFAVLVSFGIAAFIVKRFLDVSYIWPAIASCLLTGYAVNAYAKQSILQHLAEFWPANFFSNPSITILPIQMVAFGTLGAMAGFWMAVRFDYWRKHEI